MPHLYFLIKEPKKDGRVLIWDTRTLSIGRAPENDLTLEDDEVSRKHALLINEGGVCEIGDYRTGNGSFVNGQRVIQKQKIKPGDLIAIGKVQLEFRLGKEHPAKLGLRLLTALRAFTYSSWSGKNESAWYPFAVLITNRSAIPLDGLPGGPMP